MAAARVLVGKVAGGAFPAGSVVWRLVAANNCTLGRAVRPSRTVDVGLEEARRLCARLGDARVRVHDDPKGWRWTVELDGEPVAAAARPASSRRDAQSSAQTFLDLLPAASASPQVRVPRQVEVDLSPDRVLSA